MVREKQFRVKADAYQALESEPSSRPLFLSQHFPVVTIQGQEWRTAEAQRTQRARRSYVFALRRVQQSKKGTRPWAGNCQLISGVDQREYSSPVCAERKLFIGCPASGGQPIMFSTPRPLRALLCPIPCRQSRLCKAGFNRGASAVDDSSQPLTPLPPPTSVPQKAGTQDHPSHYMLSLTGVEGQTRRTKR